MWAESDFQLVAMFQASTSSQTPRGQAASKISRAFSLRANLTKLTSSRGAPELVSGAKNQQLALLDLLRLLSTLWIVSIHSYSFALAWLQWHDTEPKRSVYKSLGGQLLANGTFAVDNFFLMSGLLAFVRHRAEAGPAGQTTVGGRARLFARSLLARYARLMPALAFAILISTTLLPLLRHADSPAEQWTRATSMFDLWCRTNWPLNLLLVQNLFQTRQMCLGHSWFVAVDFQLFVVLQALLFALKPGASFTTLASVSLPLMLGGQIASALLTYKLHLPAFPLLPGASQEASLSFLKLVYIKPHHWLCSYFIGVLLAGLLLDPQPSRRANSWRLRTMKRASWLLVPLLIGSNLFYFRRELPMGRNYATLYSLLARPLWSGSVACLLLLTSAAACPLVNSSPKRRLLSTLARLSYSVYLLHPIQIAAFCGNRTETFSFSHQLLLHFLLANLVLTYLAASLVYLFIELPAQKLLSSSRNSSPRDTCRAGGFDMARTGRGRERRPENRAKVVDTN